MRNGSLLQHAWSLDSCFNMRDFDVSMDECHFVTMGGVGWHSWMVTPNGCDRRGCRGLMLLANTPMLVKVPVKVGLFNDRPLMVHGGE